MNPTSTTLRIGVDSYSYHRLLGDLRGGEVAPSHRLSDGGVAVLHEARRLELEGVSLQTCYLGPSESCDTGALKAAAGSLELVLAWGAPNGLEFGARPEAFSELLEWIDVASDLGSGTVRIVLGGPALRSRSHRWPDALPLLRRAAEFARTRNVVLAVENHGDLSAMQIESIITEVSDEAIGVCFDTANAVRVGDDVVEAAARLAPWIRMVHLKDIESIETASDSVAGPRSVVYGEGIVPLDSVLDIICDANFAGLVCVELGQLGPDVDERTMVASCVRWLRDRQASTSTA